MSRHAVSSITSHSLQQAERMSSAITDNLVYWNMNVNLPNSPLSLSAGGPGCQVLFHGDKATARGSRGMGGHSQNQPCQMILEGV